MLIENPEISVIIPAYNAESYLADCLASVIDQEFTSWELIVADDGSTDATGKICDGYASKDDRIKVIHTANNGVSEARNACLDIAKGKYLIFADADDLFERDCLKRLYDQAEKTKADIVQCSFCYLNEDIKIKDTGASDATYQGQNEIMSAYFNGAVGDIRVSVWAKLFRRESFLYVRFDSGLKVYEDAYYVFKCCLNAKSVFSFSTPLYIYRQHAKSTMHLRLAEIYPDYFKVFDKQRENINGNKTVLKMLTLRETENSLWLMSEVNSAGKSKELWNLRKLALKHAGTILISKVPIILKLKLIGLAVMPHLYFAMLKGRGISGNEKV